MERLSRPTKDEYFLLMATVVSSRSTCPRRQVGAIFVNERGHILSTGYNGVAMGMPHCTDHPCAGANMPSGVGLDLCDSIHAEQNALIQCRDAFAIHKAYVTASPCITCTKLLMNTSCQEIIFLKEYPHPQARILWEGAKRIWTQGCLENK